MYSILVTVNTVYMPFARIFFRSLVDNVNLRKIDKIYVSDTGLTDEDKKYLEQFPKTTIIPNAIKISTSDFESGSWGPSWHKNVESKTATLRRCVKKKTPIVLIDCDCLFVKDINHLIDKSFDIQVCDRSTETEISCLASFVSINNVDNGIPFIDKWIQNMQQLKNRKVANGKVRPKESKALAITVYQKRNLMKIYQMPQEIVSAKPEDYFSPNRNPDTCIVHFKGYSSAMDFATSFAYRTRFPEMQKYIDKYFSE